MKLTRHYNQIIPPKKNAKGNTQSSITENRGWALRNYEWMTWQRASNLENGKTWQLIYREECDLYQSAFVSSQANFCVFLSSIISLLIISVTLFRPKIILRENVAFLAWKYFVRESKFLFITMERNHVLKHYYSIMCNTLWRPAGGVGGPPWPPRNEIKGAITKRVISCWQFLEGRFFSSWN